MFINEKENKIGKEFIDKGYIIFDIENEQSFNHILSHFDEDLIRHNFPKENIIKNLNNTHNFIPIDDLNNFRLNIINSIKENKNFRLNYYNLAKKHLDIIVGMN